MRNKILVAEDDACLQDIYKILLAQGGYEVAVVSRGEEILQSAVPSADLYLLDRHLAGMDGLEICRFIKSKPESEHIPVIMISANPAVRELAVEAGAIDFIDKPFNIKHFLAVVSKHLEPVADSDHDKLDQ